MAWPDCLIYAKQEADKGDEIVFDECLVQQGVQHAGTEHIARRKRQSEHVRDVRPSFLLFLQYHNYTVDSQYLEYVEFCKTRSVYLNELYILIAFSSHHLASETFLQVQITRSAN